MRILANSCEFLRIFYLLIVFLLPNRVITQEINCDLPDPTEQQVQDYFTFLESISQNNRSNLSNTAYQIPVHLFMIYDNNGNGLVSPKDLVTRTLDAITVINQEYFTNGMQFYLCDATVIHNSQHHLTPSRPTLYQYIHTTLQYEDNAISIVINNENGSSSASSPDETVARLIRIAGTPDEELLAHEIGHFFYLFHTFTKTTVAQGGNPPVISTILAPDCTCIAEYAGLCNFFCSFNNTFDCSAYNNILPCNCCNSGDFIPDTNVDPGRSNDNQTPGNCPPNPDPNQSPPCIITTPSGHTYVYNPPYSNLMSYWNHNVQEFSPLQLQRMLETLVYHPNRTYLLDENEPECKDFFIVPLKGNVERIFLNQAGQWEDEPVGSEYSMKVKDNLDNNVCASITDLNGKYSLDCTTHAIFDIDATVQQDIDYNQDFANSLYNPLNGVTTADLINISRHILALQELKKPYAWLAADVNNNGSITTVDIILLRRLILGIDQNFEHIPSWRFIPQYYLASEWDFEDDFNANPFTAELTTLPDGITRKYKSENNLPSYLEELNVTEYTDDIEEEGTWSFYMIKSGDVNFDANLQNYSGSSGLTFSSPPHNCLQTGETAVVRVKAQQPDDFFGYQLGVNIDPIAVEIISIDRGNLSPFRLDYFNQDDLPKGKLRTLWLDEFSGDPRKANNSDVTLFEINVKAKSQVCDITDVITVDDAILTGGFYDLSGILPNMQLYLEVVPETVKHKLEAVYPNPGSQGFTFYFKVNDQPGQVSIVLQDSNNGAVQYSGSYNVGAHSHTLSNTSTLQTGLLTYIVTIGNEQFSGNIIKI